MNSSHTHLIINHFPIAGTLLGFLLILIFYVIRNQTTLIIGLSILIFTGLLTILTFTSGEGSEEQMEHLQGIEETRIEKHEELAERSLILIEATALLAGITLILQLKNKNVNKILIVLIILFSFSSSILLVFVNNTGGEIRHTEIRKHQ